MTIREFIAANMLTMTCEPTDTNPNMEDSANMDHWACKIQRLHRGRTRTLTLPFSMGYGHNGAAPKLDEVLDCLVSDMTEVTFEDWCNELGYDTDSRKALRTYRVIAHQTRKLERFLGESLDALIQCERL